MDLKHKIGLAVRKRRKELKMNQEELAHRVGTDQGYISLLETGQMNTTLDMMEQICEVLDVRAGDLFYSADNS